MGRYKIEYEGDKEAVYSGAGRGNTFAEVLAQRLTRRGLLRSAVAASALAVTGPRLLPTAVAAQGAAPAGVASGVVGKLGFEPIALDGGDQPVVALGHRVSTLLKWGDAILADAPEHDVQNQTAEAQAMQFGYNADWIGFLPLPRGSTNSDHGLLG